MILVNLKELECIHLSIHLLMKLFVIIVQSSVSFLFKNYIIKNFFPPTTIIYFLIPKNLKSLI